MISFKKNTPTKSSNLLYKHKDIAKLILLILLGFCIGTIIVLDPFIVNQVSSEYLKTSSYSVTILIFILITCIYLIYIYFDKITQNIVYIAILGIIIGDQTKGITPGVDLADVVIIFSVFLWLIQNFMKNRFTFEVNKFNFIILALLFIIFLSMMNGGTKSVVYFITKGLRNFLAIFIIIVNVDNKKKINFFIKSLIIVTSISAIIGICQEILFGYAGIIFPARHHVPMGLLVEETAIGTMLRISALVGSQQDLGNILAVTLAISFYLVISLNIRIFERKKYVFLCILFMSIALVLTFSTGAWLAVVFSTYIGIYFRKASYSIHFVLLSIGVIILAYFTGLLNEFGNFVNSELQLKSDLSVRLQMIRTTIEKAFVQHPYIGRGIGNSPIYISNIYGWPPHNTFVQVLAEIGIMGLIIYSLIFIDTSVKLFAYIVRLKEGKDRTVVTLLLMGFLSLIVYLQFSPFFMQLFPWIYLGILRSTIQVFSNRGHPVNYQHT